MALLPSPSHAYVESDTVFNSMLRSAGGELEPQRRLLGLLEGLLSLACCWRSSAVEKHCRPVAFFLEGLGHAGGHLLGPMCARHLLGALGILYHSIFTTALWKMRDYSLYAEEETGIG